SAIGASPLRSHCIPGGNAMKLPRRKFLHLATGAAALPAASRIAWAQAYPTRPVRMIVPFAPGGQTDAIARLVAQKLSEHFDRQFYVENMPGAGGNIGMGRAAQSMPDCYTILVVDGTSFVVNPPCTPKSHMIPTRTLTRLRLRPAPHRCSPSLRR